MHPSHAISLAAPVVGSSSEGYAKIYCDPLADADGEHVEWRLTWRSEDGSVLAEATVTTSGEVKDVASP